MEPSQKQDQPVLNIVGEKVALGPRRRDLLPLYVKWMNDFEVTRTLALGWRPMSWEDEESWYENAGKAADQVMFTIYERATLRPIGNTALVKIDHLNRTAELGIMIGEKECWGKGYGTEAVALTLDYGFTGLGLHNVMLCAYAYNEPGLRAYGRAGFKLIGRRREAHRLGEGVHDVIYMDCLAGEFQSPVLHRLLPPG